MAAEQFSLCWNNFHSNLSSGFHSLYQSEDFVDVTLAAEGRYLKAHKMVLSVCSRYFKELFQVNPCKHPIVILKDVSYNALRDLLQFMYLGEVSVSQEELSNLMKIAELLQIKGLTDGNMDPMNQNGVKNIHVSDVKSLTESRTLLKRSKSKKCKTEKSETPAKIAKPNLSPECRSAQSPNRLDDETVSQSPPPPSLLVEPELLEPIITPKAEPADEPSESGEYSEHSIPEMDMATMLDTNLGETSSQTAWKIEPQKMYMPLDTNTQDILADSSTVKQEPLESTDQQIHHFRKWIGGKAGKHRKRCAHCYKKIKDQFGTNVARSKTKQVDTFCDSCDFTPPMCLDCFKEIHSWN